MLSEWTAECGTDDPVLVVPWSSPDGSLAWVDLRDDPDALDHVHEADEHPALLAALRALNGTRSPVFTAKCDIWTMDVDELAAMQADLLLEPDQAQSGITCYIDLLWRERSVFASRARTEQMLYRLDRLAGELPQTLSKLEWIVRPAVLDLDGSVREGYAVTLYVKAVGTDEQEAHDRWDAALRGATTLMRARELSGA